MRFTVSYDAAVKIMSTLIALVLAAVALFSHSVVAMVIGAVILALSYAWSPRGYRIEGRSIVVERLIGDAQIPLEDVREVRAAKPGDFDGCIRMFGNGGVFGYYGLFRTATLGKSTWYLTNRKGVVVLVTAARTALFSPDDVEAFVAAIRGSVPVAGAVSERPAISAGLSRRSGPFNATSVLIGGTIAFVALAVAAFALLYSPGPPSYTLTGDALTIHDRFYPVSLQRNDVDISGIRIVDLDVNREWRPVERTNGFANSHYKSGMFKLSDGRPVRMYKADGSRMVLLPARGNGTTVLLDTPEPEKFIAAVRQVWSAASP